jgi:hypothetical protein
MSILTDPGRRLLKRLADEGKTTRLTLGELDVAKALEADGLVFMVRDTLNAIITAKGRHALADLEVGDRHGKRPGDV